MIEHQIETIDPDLAAEYLLLNKCNRTIKEQKVEQYATAISAGTWPFTGEPLMFGADGTLYNGQHRLLAVIRADVAVDFLVLRGLDPRAVDAIDTGIKRSLADRLAMNGEQSPKRLASAIQTHARLVGPAGYARSGTNTLTISEGLAHLEQHPRLRDTIPVGNRLVRNLKGSHAMYCALDYEMSALSYDDAAAFFGRLADGIGLKANDPAFVLRRALLAQAKKGAGKLPERTVCALFIKAWNAYRRGEHVRVLTFRAGGANPETFPTIQ